MNSKVIVVGGGPVGLVAAHALHLAGIDFVLLERRTSITDNTGASVVLGPPSLRILSQFGLREELEAAGAELGHAKSFTRDGYKFRDSTQIRLLKECLGCAQLIFHRPDLVRIIYEGLPPAARERILTQKRVTTIEESENSATVTCADGSSFVGSVVIGADGVHSQTRRQLRQAMLRQGRQADCDEEQPYESAYRMLWCTFPRPASSPPGDACETQDKDRSLGYLAGKQRGWIFLYEKLEKPTRNRVDYSEKDIERFAASFADYPISETLSFKDVFQSYKAGMANLGEGVVKNFSHDRIVLVGDACHRFTPNAALGLNNGIQDIVSVCNAIHSAVKSSKDDSLSRAALKTAFDLYHDQRLAPVKKDLRASALLTRLQAWANTWFYVSARFLLVFDWFQRFTLRHVAIPNMRLAPVLDYVSADEPYVGTIAWAHPIKSRKGGKEC